MEISKLTNDVGYKPSTKMRILQFIQADAKNNYKFTGDTTCKALGALLAQTLGRKSRSIEITLNKMIRDGMLNRRKRGGNRSKITVNYFSPLVPSGFIENASDEEKEYVQKVYRMAEERRLAGENSYVDADGVVVTPMKKRDEESKSEETEETDAKSKETKTDDEELESKDEESKSDASIEEIMMPVTLKREGRNISIAININLNV